MLPKLEQPWTLLPTDDSGSVEARLAMDEELLEQVNRGERGPCIRIWRNLPCLIATVKESRMPNFETASNALASQGWPVLVRRTGGACVPHGPGVINLSLIYPIPDTQDWQLEQSYQLLCQPIEQLLESYNLKAETGFVKGSFCDGKYNLQVAGKKLVGTAQRWRRAGAQASSASRGAILAHACLLTDLDLEDATAAINQLYRECEQPQQFITDTCETLRNMSGINVSESGGPGASESFVKDAVNRLAEIVEKTFTD